MWQLWMWTGSCSKSFDCRSRWCVLQDVDVDWFLRQWEGQYNTEWQSGSEVVVRFTTAQALKEAHTALGGGIRGVLRVDRGYASSHSHCRLLQHATQHVTQCMTSRDGRCRCCSVLNSM